MGRRRRRRRRKGDERERRSKETSFAPKKKQKKTASLVFERNPDLNFQIFLFPKKTHLISGKSGCAISSTLLSTVVRTGQHESTLGAGADERGGAAPDMLWFQSFFVLAGGALSPSRKTAMSSP